MKWIDALKVYNAGKIWCVPRKGTPEYDEVKKIMNRTKPEEVEKRNVERREKATEQLKALDTRKKIEERREKEKEASRDAVKVLQDTKPRTTVDRIAEITEQIQQELKDGMVSFDYDLGWKPDTKETLQSGGNRGVRSMYRHLVDNTAEMIDVAKLKERKRELEGKKDENNAKELDGILYNLEHWKPVNAYFGASYNYNTKTQKKDTFDEVVGKALEDYQAFAEDVNKRRRNPIRNITIRHRINADGSRTLQASWDVNREKYTYPYFVRQYDILPVFRFREGTTLASMEAEERKEQEEVEARMKAQEEKKAEKEKDPVYVLTKRIEKLQDESNDNYRKREREFNKKYPYAIRHTLVGEEKAQRDKDYAEDRKKYDEEQKQIDVLKKELSDLKKKVKQKQDKDPDVIRLKKEIEKLKKEAEEDSLKRDRELNKKYPAETRFTLVGAESAQRDKDFAEDRKKSKEYRERIEALEKELSDLKKKIR